MKRNTPETTYYQLKKMHHEEVIKNVTESPA